MLGCPRQQLTYETFGQRRHLFMGCGQATEMLLFDNSSGTMTSGYLQPGGAIVVSPAASNRYATELGCDVKTTTEQRVDFRTRVVDGCGKRITYVQVCNGTCSWIANH